MKPEPKGWIPEAYLHLTPEQGEKILEDLPEGAEIRPALEAAVERAVAEQRKINGRAGLN